MRVKVLLGALAVAVLTAGSAVAQTVATSAETQNGIPTVTIINKTTTAADDASPPVLTVTPQKPETSPVAVAPATPARAATDTVSKPGNPDGSSNDVKAAPGSSSDPNEAAKKTDSNSNTTAAGASPAPQGQAQGAAPQPPPEPTLAIDIDLTRQAMTVSENGITRFTWPISSARYGYRTPTGTYRPSWMAKMWYSRQYDDAPMPHAIFFHKGVAIHGSYATRSLGRPASHGCVRLAPKNAATLFKLVNGHGKERTEIVVHGKPDHSGARIASDGDPASSRGTVRMPRPSQYRYQPPNSYAPRGYAAYDYGPRGYSYPPRTRRAYAQPRRYYQPRGLYSGNAYGYGF